MNKTELVEAMAAQAGISKNDAKKALDAFMDVTKQALKKEQKLTLPGFLTFKVIDRPARTARNIQTGATINVPAKKVVKFRVGNNLADAVK